MHNLQTENPVASFLDHIAKTALDLDEVEALPATYKDFVKVIKRFKNKALDTKSKWTIQVSSNPLYSSSDSPSSETCSKWAQLQEAHYHILR